MGLLDKEYHIIESKTLRRRVTLILGLGMMGVGGNVMAIISIFWDMDYVTGFSWIVSSGAIGIMCVLAGINLSKHPLARFGTLLWAVIGLLATLGYWYLVFFPQDQEPFYGEEGGFIDKFFKIMIVLAYMLYIYILTDKKRCEAAFNKMNV